MLFPASRLRFGSTAVILRNAFTQTVVYSGALLYNDLIFPIFILSTGNLILTQPELDASFYLMEKDTMICILKISFFVRTGV